LLINYVYFKSDKNDGINENKAIKYHLTNINNIPRGTKIILKPCIHELSKFKFP